MVAMGGKNVQLVCVQGGDIVIMMPRRRMLREEAINLAAYLVSLACGEDDFIETLSAIEGAEEPPRIVPIATPQGGPDAA
ncbi:MAG TPA: hypothetical protein VJX23_03110 [Candidatus Binataceae bacterium]|nr:hypothetical protein [Candidatus Binataceae bacterium]